MQTRQRGRVHCASVEQIAGFTFNTQPGVLTSVYCCRRWDNRQSWCVQVIGRRFARY